MTARDQPNTAWCTTAQVLAWPEFTDLGGVDLTLIDQLCMVASTWLWRATGRQYPGPGTVTVRPVPPWGRLGQGLTAETFDSHTGGFLGGCGGRGEYASEILLGHHPVRTVSQVVIEGQILSPSAYRIDDARWLVRLDGQSWPIWQDWSKASGPSVGGAATWEVSLTWGEDPPPDGIFAAQILTGHLALAATSSGQCRLPNRVQSVVRQGTSMLLVDPTMLLAGGMWGIAEVDMFVHAVNPAHLMAPATMTSPDVGRAIRRAGTLPGS